MITITSINGDPDTGERVRLPDRRNASRQTLKYQNARGSDCECEISFGFDRYGIIREMFCLAAQEGSDMQGIVHDACIATSIALQRGARIAELAASFDATSVIGKAARAGASLELELAVRE